MGTVREEKRREEERRSEKRKSQRKEDAGARKSRKVAKHCACPMICGSGRSKSRLAEAAGAEPSGQMRDEKLHAVVARSTCRSQNCKKKDGLRPLLEVEVEMSKSARGCSAKHISKSTCIKHTRAGALLEVEMSNKCTPLWREAHLQVKMYKTHQGRSTFGSWDVEKVYTVAARSTFSSQHVQNAPGSEHFWKLKCRKRACRLWREAHLEVEMSLRMACVRDCAPCQKLLKGEGFVPVSATTTTTTLQLQLHYATLH